MDVEWVEKFTYAGYFENPLETPAPDVEPGAEGGTSVSVTVGESDSLGIAFMTKHRTDPCDVCVSMGQTLRAIIIAHILFWTSGFLPLSVYLGLVK